MEVEVTFKVEEIIKESKKYFPFITETNFSQMFKLSAEIVAKRLESCSRHPIRDFLILLYFCRHATNSRHISVLFNLSRSRIGQIINQPLDFWAPKLDQWVHLENLIQHPGFFLENCIGCVDGCEFQINAWIGDSYSGKQGHVSRILLISLMS